MSRPTRTLTVHEQDVVGEFRHVAPGRGRLAAHYLPALAHALLASRPRPALTARDVAGPWRPGAAHRCLLARPAGAGPAEWAAVHWAHPRGDDLALGWALLHQPGDEATPDPGTPEVARAWAWAEQVHESVVVPVLAQLTGRC